MSTSGSADARPAAEGLPASHFPGSPVQAGHVAPAARRVRATLAGRTVLDTTRALYVWEQPWYPQYRIPAADVDASLLVDDGEVADTPLGQVQLRSLVAGDRREEGAAQFLPASDVPGLAGTYAFRPEALDAWFEEDELVHGHPRSPYSRVDALRANRHVRVELEGQVLAEADTAVALCETGLPTRWYLERTAVRWQHLVPSDTRTLCPYKGRTTGYWSARAGERLVEDVAWSYDFPLREVAPLAGLVAFLDEAVDVLVDGVPTRG